MSDWQYTHVPHSEVRLAVGPHTYFHYRFATDRDRPYAHPVTLALPGGAEALTCYAPHDHTWHAGFWFNWKYIDEVNYWENAADGHPEGRTQLDGPERLTATPERVSLEAPYAYVDPHRGAVATEERRLTWHRPSADDGSHATDVTVAFHAPAAATAPVVLDRTPINAQTPWGGYAGLSWRFSRALGAAQGCDAQGRRNQAIEHQRAAWATLGGKVDGGPDLQAGVAVFDHPANLGHPTHWRYITDPGFAYLNPSPVLAGPIAVAPGETLTLRYRVLVYAGPPDPARLAREHAAFAQA